MTSINCPGWCAEDVGTPPIHLGPPAVVGKILVKLLQGSDEGPYLFIGGKSYPLPYATGVGKLLAELGHAELAAAVARAVMMAKEDGHLARLVDDQPKLTLVTS